MRMQRISNCNEADLDYTGIRERMLNHLYRSSKVSSGDLVISVRGAGALVAGIVIDGGGRPSERGSVF